MDPEELEKTARLNEKRVLRLWYHSIYHGQTKRAKILEYEGRRYLITMEPVETD